MSIILLSVLSVFLPLLGIFLMSMRPIGADRDLFPKCDPVDVLRELTLGIKSQKTRDENPAFVLGLICIGAGIYLIIFLAIKF